jgi:hypothetical protein
MFLAREPEAIVDVLRDLKPDYLYMDDRKPGPVTLLRSLVGTGLIEEAYTANHIHVLEVSPRR